MTDTPLPLTFRSREVSRIFHILQAGDSCQLVGVGSVGKSNLVRYLLLPEVRRRYLGEAAACFAFVNVDANKLAARSDWGVAELMLHQLRIELSAQALPEGALNTLNALYDQSTDPDSPFRALRSLDVALAAAFHHLPDLSIVFVIDDFDQLGRELSPQTFDNLRAFRDEHKYHLSYLIASRRPLTQLRANPAEIENFNELVAPNTMWISVYTEEDAREMVARLAGRYRQALSEDETTDLLRLSGGHPGLLRGIFIAHRKGAAQLAQHPAVLDECEQIWRSLTGDEQAALNRLTNSASLDMEDSTGELLAAKGLIGGAWVEPRVVFSPLFAQFLREQQPAAGAKIFIDQRRRAVEVDGRRITDLAPLEFHCLEILVKHRGNVLTKDNLAEQLYQDEQIREGFSDERIDAVVKRLRKRIEPDPGHPRYIVTVRGVGYCLQDGKAQAEG